MEIAFNGNLTKNLLKDAMSLEKNTPNKICATVILKCLAITVAMLIVPSVEGIVRLYAFILIAVFLVDIFNTIKWKSNFIPNLFQKLPKKWRGTISEQEIVFLENGSKCQFEWFIFEKYKTSGKFILIYDPKDRFFIFHKSWFQNDKDWDNFKLIIADKFKC